MGGGHRRAATAKFDNGSYLVGIRAFTSAATGLREGDDDFAEVFAALLVLEGGRGVGKCKDAVNHGFGLMQCDGAVHGLEHRAAADVYAAHNDELADDFAQRDFAGESADAADEMDLAARCDGAE